MKLASHNSASFGRPKRWWLWPFRFMAQCQGRNIEEQYEAGARVFDLRIVFNKKGEEEFAHGLITFDVDVFNTLLTINSFPEKCFVRLLCERDKDHDKFIKFCENVQDSFHNITFYGGQNKKDWKLLFTFKSSGPNVVDKYSSSNYDTDKQTGTYLDDLFPRIYAWRNNKKWREFYKDQDVYLMQDFVGVY